MFIALLGATAVVFSLSRMAGDPVLLYAKPGGYGSEQFLDNLRKKLGTDRPLVVQYTKWVWLLAQGDFGRTLLAERPVIEVIKEKIWHSFELAFAGWLFATVIGVPLGVLSAVKRGTYWDYVGRGFALFGQALPSFWVGIMLVVIFAVNLGWVPVAFRGGEGFGLDHYLANWEALYSADRHHRLGRVGRIPAHNSVLYAGSARLRVRQTRSRQRSRHV